MICGTLLPCQIEIWNHLYFPYYLLFIFLIKSWTTFLPYFPYSKPWHNKISKCTWCFFMENSQGSLFLENSILIISKLLKLISNAHVQLINYFRITIPICEHTHFSNPIIMHVIPNSSSFFNLKSYITFSNNQFIIRK